MSHCACTVRLNLCCDLRRAGKVEKARPRRHIALAGQGGWVYMLAKASIVLANIPARGDLMRPYYKPSNYTMRNSVGYLMRVATNRLLPQTEALFEDQELTFSQWTTLVALHSGITTAGDLAHNICHDAGSLTRLIDEMVKRGLVTRGRSETDRRVVTLALTRHGEELVEQLAPKMMNFWNGLLAGFSHAEIDTLINLLTRLLLVAEGQPRKNKLFNSDIPIAKSKAKKTS
jgi:DNA-binding MarR family transcriptional regulator